jgi:ABC-2 type transport system permease protein
MKKIKTIIRKEWAEIFKNRMVIFTVAFLPLIMAAIPLGMLFAMRGTSGSSGIDSLPPEVAEAIQCPTGLSSGQCFQVYMISQFMMMFMLIPVAIPMTIAAYSIVGEKTTRSLEPLLATPITTLELLAGKCLGAVVPAILATFAAFGIFAGGAWLAVENKSMLAALFDLRWLIAIFVVGPLLALMAVAFGLMVSSRVNDPRVAEQLSIIIILPVMLAIIGQFAGWFFLNATIIAWTAAALLLLDMFLISLAVNVFQREAILTRWK